MEIKELEKNDYVYLEQMFCLHPLQSYAWGEVKSLAWKPLRVGVYKDETPVAAFSVLERRIPLTGKSFAYIPRANIPGDKNIVDALVAFGKERKLSHLMIDPDISFLFPEKQNSEIISILSSLGFLKFSRQIQPNRTVALDLSKSSKDLFSEMKSKHRQYIRKSQRDGVRIRLGKEHDLNEFCSVIKSIVATKGHVMHECGYYKRVWEHFSKQERSILLIALREETVLGSYMIIFNDENAYEMYGGCNEEGNRLRANYLMKWEAINYCKTIGKKFYDQWGAEEWYPGLVQFKEGFGGKGIEYPPQFVYVYDKVSYSIYKFMEGINRLKQKLL